MTQHDRRAFLQVAPEILLKPEVQTWPLPEANLALRALKEGYLVSDCIKKICKTEGYKESLIRFRVYMVAPCTPAFRL